MKIINYNVNGLRAVLKKDFLTWLRATDADVLCLQEIKIYETDFPKALFEQLGYECFVYSAQKAGYSGVAILTKIPPKAVVYGCGIDTYDTEGRVLRVDFEQLSVMSVYMPSGTSSESRQGIKQQFLQDFYPYIQELLQKQPNLVISGDYNIAHTSIDIHNPKANANTPGFLPHERAWLSNFLDLGFVDTFRYFNSEPHQYSWWSYRAGARKKNLGWRIDYQLLTKTLENHLKRSFILSEAYHSDHAPLLLEIEI
jgi:exodeoxyribonuclease III